MARTKLVNGERIPLTAEEEAARDAEEAAWAAGAFDRAIADLRATRNRLLSETDYLALSDNTLSAEMNTYRQALRDLTNGLTTVDEVNGVTWPTKPQHRGYQCHLPKSHLVLSLIVRLQQQRLKMVQLLTLTLVPQQILLNQNSVLHYRLFLLSLLRIVKVRFHQVIHHYTLILSAQTFPILRLLNY